MASVGLSFLKVLENPTPEIKNSDVYIHPMVKRSASTLSTKSLEMCTESLGSETGSESGDEFGVISMTERDKLRAIQRSICRNFDRKVRRTDFPPPLTSISGSDAAVKVKHHREGGRLVIKAVSVSNCGTSFKAERTSGRLKLTLLKDCCVDYESGGGENEECESGGAEVENYESEGGEMEVYEEGEEVDGDEEEEVVAEDGGCDGGCDGGLRWGMDGERWPVAAGNGEWMVTRCKEGGNGNKVFANWGSSWVAIS
ncbi:hypothetical protein QVD17_15353 [Tagetes erecta]|uniref:FAF domain-containing protein n=1 Tax=Tagetes erecta TaxID=13708 RepID=A0AAD8NZK7_TARER|nr:hypothetical protein QVD17_15353 [Tagetes erecta]